MLRYYNAYFPSGHLGFWHMLGRGYLTGFSGPRQPWWKHFTDVVTTHYWSVLLHLERDSWEPVSGFLQILLQMRLPCLILLWIFFALICHSHECHCLMTWELSLANHSILEWSWELLAHLVLMNPTLYPMNSSSVTFRDRGHHFRRTAYFRAVQVWLPYNSPTHHSVSD